MIRGGRYFIISRIWGMALLQTGRVNLILRKRIIWMDMITFMTNSDTVVNLVSNYIQNIDFIPIY